MSRPRRLRASLICTGISLSMLAAAGPAMSQGSPSLPAHPFTDVIPVQLLTQSIADSTPNAAQLRRGQSLVVAGDCMSCHLRDGGEPFAGGLALRTPFGVIYSPNITSDKETGIGNWTREQFYGALHEGIDDEGRNLYPAFPYPWFRLVSREDSDAMLAYLKSTPAVRYTPPETHLPFPLNFRVAVKGWNFLYLKSREFEPDPRQSSEWNRGAYLVDGLGHCGGCHTPKNSLGADKSQLELQGGDLDQWVAPDLTGNARTGLGAWSVDDIAEYLHDGRNARAGAGGPMAEVVTYSTSLMSDADRHAMAVYLKAQAASSRVASSAPDSDAMRRGAAIYSDACSSCHLEDGVGQPGIFPPLGPNAVLQQRNPLGVEHLILAGVRIGRSPSHPSAFAMPSFAWKLSDQEVADVATFLRNSWGNQAAGVSAADVAAARKKLGLDTIHLTANSGDRD